LTGLAITPATASIAQAATTQLTATASYTDGTTADVTSAAAWSTSAATIATVNASGLVTGAGSGTATITATFEEASTTATVVVAGAEEPLPPDPATVAPTIDPTEVGTVHDLTRFLYEGPSPIQTGVAPNAIEPLRAAVLRGRVLRRGGATLSGVGITILGHSEYGRTLTRADGRFDCAVNGGGPLTVQYRKSGFIPVDREISAAGGDYGVIDDVVMIPLDPAVTSVDLSTSAVKVARGTTSVDSSGSRTATLLFPPVTTATMTLANGSTQAINQMSVRATEYTVGSDGPASMPAALPPHSGYTYCMELSADEAMASGATRIDFSKPVAFYVENFLGFPGGSEVPVGYYDRVRGVWVPSDNGRVVTVVTIVEGRAYLDVDGDLLIDDSDALIGTTIAEREKLSTLYSPGQSLWRATMTHFTPVDLNWSVSLPADATLPTGRPRSFTPCAPCTESESDSLIETENQTLGQTLPVAGAPFRLSYRSDRTRGRVASRTLDIPLSGATIPASLTRIDLEIAIAGTLTRIPFPAQPNQTYRYIWDGRDAYGRALEGGGAPVSITTTYVYPGEMQNARAGRAFGLASGERSGIASRFEMTTSTRWQGHLGARMSVSDRMGGWTLSPHHFYDVATKTLYRGDGSRQSDLPQRFGVSSGVISTVAGTGILEPTWQGVGGPAKDARITDIEGMAVAPDGSLYIASQDFIHKITPDGILHRVAGKRPSRRPTVAELQTAQPAAGAQLFRPRGFSFGPDGSVYVVEPALWTVRRITPEGDIVPFAGTGAECGQCFEEGVPAVSANLVDPMSVAAAPDGSVYIAEAGSNRIRRVSPDGIITTVAGNGISDYAGDGGPAFAAALLFPESLALGPDGSLYFGDSNRIRRVTPDGMITRVAGNGEPGNSGDGGPATDASFRLHIGGSTYLSVAADGSLFFSDRDNAVRKVDPAGIITTVAGTGVRGVAPDGELATATDLNDVEAVTTGPDGTIYFTENQGWKIRAVRSVLPALTAAGTEMSVADGSVVHVFSDRGRHLRTMHANTGATLYSFGYAAGLLSAVTDRDGNVTSVERDPNGNAVAINAPGGQRTAIAAGSYATSITTAQGETTQFQYTADGLMTRMIDPRANETEFSWNSLGLLTGTEDAEEGAKVLSRTETANGHTVTITTAEGKTRSYTTEVLSNGDTHRRILDEASLVTTMVQHKNNTIETTLPDGSSVLTKGAADPVFGMQSPFTASTTLTLPSGRSIAAFLERLATVAQVGNVQSIATRTDRVTIGGKTFTSTFDRAELTETWTTPLGQVITRAMDDVGRTRLVTLPSPLAAIAYDYDGQGRLASVTQGARQRTFGYNSKNELTSITDALQRTMRLTHDDAGRVIRQALPDEREVGFLYDSSGNLTSVTPPGRPSHSFDFTKVNLTNRYTPPASSHGGVTEYVYNHDRMLSSVERPGGSVIGFDYDGAGRLATLTWPAGALTYHYENNGALGAISGADASLTYGWDGPYPTSMTWSGAVSGSVNWTYDDRFRRASETAAGDTVAFSYDDDGRFETVGGLQFHYVPETGMLDYVDLGESVLYPTYPATEDWRTFNEYGEVIELGSWYAGDARQVFGYERDNGGRITGITETEGQSVVETGYAYDQAGRLQDVTTASRAVHYEYDTNGNRSARQVTTGGVTTTEAATYDPQDRLLTYGGTQYTYTANGDLLTKVDTSGTSAYDYDALGNLRGVTLPDGKRIDYLIDGQNRRVGKRVNGALVQQWLYGDQLRILAELDGNGNAVSRFVYATRSNSPDYMIRDDKTYRIFHDHLGSTRTIVDVVTETVVATMAYDEFGQVVIDTNAGFQPFGFAGGLYDPDTRLVRFGARDYDSQTGRWTAKDPIGFGAHDTNLYAYTFGDPVNFTDPNGTQVVYGGSSTSATIFGGQSAQSGVVVSPTNGGVYSGSGPQYGGSVALAQEAQLGVLPNTDRIHDLEKVSVSPGFSIPIEIKKIKLSVGLSLLLDEQFNIVGFQLSGGCGLGWEPKKFNIQVSEGKTVVKSYGSIMADLEHAIKKLYGVP
jgi:RHS repeat-associated protein